MSYTYSSIKNRAIRLRKNGKSYNEINKLLNIPKSTLSTWLKNLPISQNVRNKNIEKAKNIWSKNISDYNKKRAKKYQVELKRQINKFSQDIPEIDKKNLFWIGLSLFWAEGGKKEKWMVRFTNSDPIMIKIMMKFFREICNIKNNKIKLCIHLHSNVSEAKAKKYWSNITRLAIDNFWKSQTQISSSSKGKRPRNRLPYGTLHVIIMDSYLVKKIRGWNLGLAKQIINMPG
jgi:hypothetical protein